MVTATATEPAEETHCECGVALDEHPPLEKPKPLTSWMAEKYAGSPSAIAGAMAARTKVQPVVIRRRPRRAA